MLWQQVPHSLPLLESEGRAEGGPAWQTQGKTFQGRMLWTVRGLEMGGCGVFWTWYISHLKFSPDTLQMQEVVEMHIIQNPSQEKNLTLKQKGKWFKCWGAFTCTVKATAHKMFFTKNSRRLAAAHTHSLDYFIFISSETWMTEQANGGPHQRTRPI